MNAAAQSVRFLIDTAKGMTYISPAYWVMVGVLIPLYFLFPKKLRYLVLLAGSVFFYLSASSSDIWILPAVTAVSYFLGILLEKITNRGLPDDREVKKMRRSTKCLLAFSIVLCLFPLLWSTIRAYAALKENVNLALPLGLSFYTLQILSYLTDVARGRVHAQKNPFKYALFVSFFPQILQGPIPRYEQLGEQLFEGHSFETRRFVRGCQLILWGFFLKFVVADKAGIAVNTIFGEPDYYVGQYVLVGGVLYSIQLYADFLSCVELSRGVSEIFGIGLANNFNHPYFAVSVGDFWRRWHISLSTWLRDYVYIPLGGNRHGRLRQYGNIILTFLVSGLWHGIGAQYLVWGCIHAAYQIVEKVLEGFRKKAAAVLQMPFGSLAWKCVRVPWTFVRVMLAWIIFRAPSLRQGICMIRSLFCVHNPWILFDGSLDLLGLDSRQWHILSYSVLLLIGVSILQNHINIRDWILRQHILIRWTLYFAAIAAVVLFGTYGFGYDASSFIYGGF